MSDTRHPLSEISAAALILGLAASIYGAYQIFHAYRSSHWPSVHGRILDVVQHETGGEAPSCDLILKYEYPIPLVTNEGEASLSCGDTYQRGQIVEVFYDPNNPAKSELELGAYFAGIFQLLFGLALMRFGYTPKPGKPDASNDEGADS